MTERREVQTKERTAIRPARKWRNRYISASRFQFPNGRVVGPGPWLGSDVWPSYEIAEQVGYEFMERWREWADHFGIAYDKPVEVE